MPGRKKALAAGGRRLQAGLDKDGGKSLWL